MNTLIAVAIAPCGTGDEFAPYVAEIVRIIRESGLPNRTNSMFTEIEGEWDDVMAVVKKSDAIPDGPGPAGGSRLESRYPTGLYEYDEQ